MHGNRSDCRERQSVELADRLDRHVPHRCCDRVLDRVPRRRRRCGGPIDVLGSYEAGDQTWGWRTTYESEGDRLLVRHYNVMRGAEAALAVEFDYRRR